MKVTVVFMTFWLIALALPKHGNNRGLRILVDGSNVSIFYHSKVNGSLFFFFALHCHFNVMNKSSVLMITA